MGSEHPLFSLSNVTQLSFGNSHECAMADGVVYCWGDNSFGQSTLPPIATFHWVIPYYAPPVVM